MRELSGLTGIPSEFAQLKPLQTRGKTLKEPQLTSS
jgi:hypothetical protein